MNSANKITVYSAQSKGFPIIRILVEMIRDLPESHELGQRFFKRNIKAMYRQSVLGLFWAFVPPLMTAGLWIFLKGSNVANFGETAIPYAVYVVTGTILWQIFAESLQAPLNGIIANRNVLVKINIPREGILVAEFYTLIFNLAIKLLLLVFIFLYFKQTISLSILAAPLGIISIVLCGFSLGIVLIPIGMLYKDIQKILAVILPFLMYLTPVVYPPKADGLIGTIIKINPMANLLLNTRNLLTAQPVFDLYQFIGIAVFFFILLFLGLVTFKVAMPMIIERIGS